MGGGGGALGSFSSFYITSMLYTWFFHGKRNPNTVGEFDDTELYRANIPSLCFITSIKSSIPEMSLYIALRHGTDVLPKSSSSSSSSTSSQSGSSSSMRRASDPVLAVVFWL